MAADELESFRGDAYWDKYYLLCSVLAEQGELDRAIREAESLVREYQTEHSDAGWMDFLVELYAKKRDLTMAGETALAMKARLDESGGGQPEWYPYALGWIELGKGNYGGAAEQFQTSLDFADHFLVRYCLARSYLEAGRIADAVREYDRLLRNHPRDKPIEALRAAKAYYYAGIAYERSGWTDRAIATYESFLDLWKDADPGLEVLDDARVRLARLHAGS